MGSRLKTTWNRAPSQPKKEKWNFGLKLLRICDGLLLQCILAFADHYKNKAVKWRFNSFTREKMATSVPLVLEWNRKLCDIGAMILE